MPGIEGFEMSIKYRRRELLGQIPAIFNDFLKKAAKRTDAHLNEATIVALLGHQRRLLVGQKGFRWRAYLTYL